MIHCIYIWSWPTLLAPVNVRRVSPTRSGLRTRQIAKVSDPVENNSCNQYTLGWPEPYIYGVYTVFWQINHQMYGHIQYIYSVLANPKKLSMIRVSPTKSGLRTRQTAKLSDPVK
jgi:hypothetical protein